MSSRSCIRRPQAMRSINLWQDRLSCGPARLDDKRSILSELKSFRGKLPVNICELHDPTWKFFIRCAISSARSISCSWTRPASISRERADRPSDNAAFPRTIGRIFNQMILAVLLDGRRPAGLHGDVARQHRRYGQPHSCRRQVAQAFFHRPGLRRRGSRHDQR